jgi:hypothetical protein
MSEIEHYIGVNLSAGHDEEDLKDLVGALRTRTCVDYAVLMANGPEVDTPEPTRAELPIMGRELALISALTKRLRAAAWTAHGTKSPAQHRRSQSFEVMIHVDGEPTGHIARVTVELDRFDRDLVEAYQREQGER